MERKWPASAQWTEDDVAHQGSRNKDRIDSSVAKAMKYLTDPDKKKRLERCRCLACFYSGPSLSGQAFTEWNCRVCLKDQSMWPNTNPPLSCEDCAKKFKICLICGADLHLRVKRSNTLLLPDSKKQ